MAELTPSPPPQKEDDQPDEEGDDDDEQQTADHDACHLPAIQACR